MKLQERLAAARLAAGKTQRQVANEAKPPMDVTQYNGYENGRSRPNRDTLERLSVPLNRSVEYFIGQDELTSEASESADAHCEETVSTLRDALRLKVAAQLGLPPEDIVVRIEIT